MLVDRGNESLLRGGDYVVDSIAGGGRAGIVVVAPCHIDRTFETAAKVDHIIVGHSIQFFGSVHSFHTEEMRIAPCPARFITGHVAKGRRFATQAVTLGSRPAVTIARAPP